MALGWIRPKTATLPELESQHAAARTAHDAAVGSVSAAQIAFDEDGSDTAARALTKAHESAATAHLHVERAERLMLAARERAAADARAAQLKRLEDINDALSSAAISEALAPHIESELNAYAAAATAYVARTAALQGFMALDSERHRLRESLGLVSLSYTGLEGRAQFAPLGISTEIRRMIAAAGERDTPRAGLLAAIARGLDGGVR